MGHSGIDKMTLRARESVFWPGILNDIRTLAETCTVCQENSKSQPKEIQQQTEVPLHAWERLGIDLLELNKEHFLLVVDYYSRFPVLRKVNSLSIATTVLHMTQIFSEYGIPKTVVTDGGPQFNTVLRLCTTLVFPTHSLPPIAHSLMD